MRPPDKNQLVSYLYGETDETTSEAIDRHLECSQDDRAQIDEWRTVMSLLDHWTVAGKPRKRQVYLPRMMQAFKMAAAVAVLVGAGVVLGLQLGNPVLESDHAAVAELVDAQVETRLTEERLKMIAKQQQIEQQLLMASASRTHQQVQGYVQKAIEHLDHYEMRNEMLALLLPAAEQQAYHSKRADLQAVASRVQVETARQQQYMQQIIARARERALASAH